MAETDGSILKSSGEECRTEVAALKVKTEPTPIRIAQRPASYARVLPVLIIIVVLGSAVGRAQSVSAEDARCRALATTDFSTVAGAPRGSNNACRTPKNLSYWRGHVEVATSPRRVVVPTSKARFPDRHFQRIPAL